MIEELKLLIDALGGVGELAGWLVGAFILYQVILYLSTTGAIVFILKLAIERIHDAITRPKIIHYQLGTLLFLERYEPMFLRAIAQVTTRKTRQKYSIIDLHELREDDIAWLSAAIREKLARENETD